MDEKRFLSASDVASLMCVSVPMAYKIIKKLNNELSEMGYITVAGKVSRKFFEDKTYGGESALKGVS